MSGTAVFAGRVEELKLLSQYLRRTVAGEPTTVMLEGPPGAGKSALLREFATRAGQRHKASWVFRVIAPDDGRYEPIPQAAREATNKELYDRVGGRRRAIESARSLLPEWINAVPVWGNLAGAVIATAQTLRRRRKRRAHRFPLATDDDCDALLAVATRHPLVLLFDELHLADDEAAAQLERLIRAALPGSRLLVVGAYRPTPPGAGDPAVRRLIAALPPGTVQFHRLLELTAAELEFWLKKRFPHVHVPPGFLASLHDRTGGHPAAVEAMLAHLLRQSAIRFVNRRWEIEREPFETQEDGVSERDAPAPELGGVNPAVVRVLEAASVLGNEFHGIDLASLLDADELYVEDQLAAAAHHRLVEAIGEAMVVDDEITTRYRFGSTHLRSRLYHGMSSERRAELERVRASATTRL